MITDGRIVSAVCLCSSHWISTPSTGTRRGDCGVGVNRDYLGASNVGIRALLVRRLGAEGEGEHKEPGEDLTGVSVIRGLSEVVDEVLKSRSDT